MGSRRTISTSNIRKITASRKNRRENGMRADLFGSNPHSNGEVFSRSLIARAFKVHLMRNTAVEIIKAVITKYMVCIIPLGQNIAINRIKSPLLLKASKERYWV